MAETGDQGKSGDSNEVVVDLPSRVFRQPSGQSVPLSTRLAHEIPKPKDWQALQRGCVILFRDELNDPNTVEYGRGGQDQRGIDVIGRRNGDPNHYVGVQCRRVTKPLKQAKILSDCRAALQLEAGLKEIIFATTAEDDTHATDAAVERGRSPLDGACQCPQPAAITAQAKPQRRHAPHSRPLAG